MPYKDPEKNREVTRRWRRENPGANHKWDRENSERAAMAARLWAQANPDKIREARNRWLQKNYEKRRAQQILQAAISDGRVIRPDKCLCGRSKPEGHHSDYSKPLEVIWACKKCHVELDAKRRAA